MSSSLYISDEKLLERVRHRYDGSIDSSAVADLLLADFPEYRRKKRRVLTNQVNKAMSCIIQQNLPVSNGIPFSVESSDKVDHSISSVDRSDTMNDAITQLYANPRKGVECEDVTTEPAANGDDTHPKRITENNHTSNEKRIKLKHNTHKNKSNKSVESSTEDTLIQSHFVPEISDTNFSHVGGLDKILNEIRTFFIHFQRSDLFVELGIHPPTGMLLQGPPGCGKTLLARAISGEFCVPMISVAGTELVSGISGESENQIRKLFDSAASSKTPVILFLDELDAVAPKREDQSREMERRIVSQLLICMDELNKNQQDNNKVFVIGATSRVSAIDPSLRRSGRFDREVRIGIPNEAARESILQVICKNLKMVEDVNLSLLSHLTPGYVAADLFALAQEAALNCVSTFLEVDKNETNLENLKIQNSDFEKALKKIQPSSMREGFATIPNVRWSEVGALQEVKTELALSILAPIRYPQHYAALYITKPPGILLAGPPGCGKTMLAKALANEAGLNFLSIKGPELMNMYVGETERAVRQVFERARNSSPCVVFFDEVDALCPKRSESGESSVTARVVNQMLTEMDGMEPKNQVYFLGATNRPDMIDPALLRPGRIDKTLYVGLPTQAERAEILSTLTKDRTQPNISSEVKFEELAASEKTGGFSGADLAALIHEASQEAFREFIKSVEDVIFESKCENYLSESFEAVLFKRHFDVAVKKVHPSVKSVQSSFY